MRILLCGDALGIAQLMSHIPEECVIGFMAASIRPQYLAELNMLVKSKSIPLLIQPTWKSSAYESFRVQVEALKADLIWVNSYSMIIRDDVLSTTRLGGLNIHDALLPRYRGCNPTQWSIIHQEFQTGVTLHEIDSGLDTGPIIDQRKVQIFIEDTWLDVRSRLQRATDSLLRANVPKVLSENWTAFSQNERDATVGSRRRPEDGRFHWSAPVMEIHNKIRALVPPLPGASYQLSSGEWMEIRAYQTPWQITASKYSSVLGGGFLQSQNTRLRPLEKADARLLYQWIADRDRVINNVPYFPISETDHEQWVEQMMTKRSDLVIFVIEELETCHEIGSCQLLNINWIHSTAELQISIGPSKHDEEGYLDEAVQLLCTFGFSELNLHRIYLHVLADNALAIRAYEKCGFVKEGLLREAAYVAGQKNDMFLMARLDSQ
jgi:methionyl-tRNA formyltransferase/RimJ/RimL family protein N-acetyltransferase